jgi:hypothetical protein
MILLATIAALSLAKNALRKSGRILDSPLSKEENSSVV